jgi:hypothetical protein
MAKGILIVGNESGTFSALTSEAAKQERQFAAAPIPSLLPHPPIDGIANAQAAQGEDKPSGQITLQWNPGSPISARTLVLAAENRLGRIDRAILVCQPPSFYRPVEELIPVEVDVLASDHIKSWFFLLRELAIYFRKREGGIIALVSPELAAAKEARQDLFGGPAAAAFRSLAQALLDSQEAEPFSVLAASRAAVGAEADFAARLFRAMERPEKNGGKWLRLGKKGLF